MSKTRYIINKAELHNITIIRSNIFTDMQSIKDHVDKHGCSEEIYITKLTGKGNEKIFSKFEDYFNMIDEDRHFPKGTMLNCWKGMAAYAQMYKSCLSFTGINFVPYIYGYDGKTYQCNFVHYNFKYGDPGYYPIDYPIEYKLDEIDEYVLDDMIYEIKEVDE